MNSNQIRQFVLSIVKPLKSGKLFSQNDGKATLTDIYPEGTNQNVRDTSPFGMVSKAPKGVTAFYQALFGSGHESIILALFHKLRPTPSSPGETILYSTNANGDEIKVKVTLKNDGSLEISAPANITITGQDLTVNCQNATIVASAKTKIDSPLVEIGSGALEQILNGETFKTLYESHTHIGNLGYPTGAPTTPLPSNAFSSKVKAAK